ncbi:hypothetical protein [Pseudoalteromonas sp. PS5]|uniref:hypothetical protein n=1 Tax=Pseudoalteromonas sp. PS5 TaxID=1437473 RepID=UPI000FFF2EB8|nr:hypothetical protein [Pseudoalteromonas sp. PS5]RXE96037.1 hypothetical protein D9603_19270 [Pseudoalteromonas sp. PS5]
MSSKFLNFSLLLIALLTKPKSWIVTGASLLVLTVMKFFFEGQSIFFKHWNDIWAGMINPAVPLEQKVFIVSFFILVTGLAMYYTNIFKLLVIHQYKRFGSKPKV